MLRGAIVQFPVVQLFSSRVSNKSWIKLEFYGLENSIEITGSCTLRAHGFEKLGLKERKLYEL
jgi:hypothetical protein